MQWSLYIFLSIVFNTISIIPCFASNCFLDTENYRCRLGSNTPYRSLANYDDTPLEYPGCTAKKIWIILRHGTRYPGKKQTAAIIKELPRLQHIILENYHNNKTNLSENTAALFKEWKVSVTKKDVMNLAQEGENEMIDLGERFQSRFPSIMPDVFSNKTYRFKYTDTQRTRESARHFAAGLFGWHNSENVWYPTPESRDPVLRFYKRCLRWRSEVDKNPNAQIEKEKFLKGPTLAGTLRDISNRLGHKINYETASLMYTMCAFDTAWNSSAESPWCKIFLLNDLKVLEFVQDLEYYWVDGYGYKLTYEQACPALNDMFHFFSSADGQRVSAYFTHSGTVLKLLALLGVAKDDRPLTHDLFSSYGDQRAWKTGLIDSFATNLAFVLYECEKGPGIVFMHQERPVYLQGCPGNGPCPMPTMKALYPDHEQECQFDAMCYLAESNGES